MSEPERLKEIIARKSFSRAAKKSQRLGLIRLSWDAVAEDLSAHTLPTKLARGTLTVRAQGAAWASEASMRTPGMLARLERMLGKGAVKRIRVQSGAASGDERDAVDTPARGGGEADLPGGELGEKLDKIGDAEVRSALARLARASKASERSEQT